MSRELKRIALLGLLVFSTPFMGRGQTFFSLFPDSLQFFPDTVLVNTQFTHEFYLQNLSPMSYTGNVAFIRTVNGLFPDTTLALINVTLAQGDTIPYTLPDSSFAPRYGGGVNIVVVWPDAPGVQTQDSFVHLVFVDTGMAFSDKGIWRNLKVGPVPASDFVNVYEGDAKLTEIWLVNAAGIPVRRWRSNLSELDVTDVPSGAYTLVFFDRGGERVARHLVVH